MRLKRFLLTCDPGLEDVVSAELAERELHAEPPDTYSGRVFTHADGPESFAELRSVHHIREIRLETEMPAPDPDQIAAECLRLEWPELKAGATFRASCERNGRHTFDSQQVERAVGGALDDAYPAKVKLKGWDYEICADIRDTFLSIGIRHTEYSLQRRFEKPFSHKAPLKSTVAYAMLRMADPRPGDTLLDPFCGGGTLLLEAASILPESVRILGSDLHPASVAGCADNLEANGLQDRAAVCEADARALETRYSDVTHIVSNLPYGQRIMRGDQMRALYDAFLESAQKVLRPGGKLTLLTEKGGLLVHIARRHEALKLASQRNIRSGRLKLYMIQFVYQPE